MPAVLRCPFCKATCTLKHGVSRGFKRVGITCDSDTGSEHYAFITNDEPTALKLHDAITDAVKGDRLQTISILASKK